jgi:hypothetical protein
MRLTEHAITIIKADKFLRFELVGNLKRDSTTIYKALDTNADNGLLTTFVALETIKKHTNLTDKEILQ